MGLFEDAERELRRREDAAAAARDEISGRTPIIPPWTHQLVAAIQQTAMPAISIRQEDIHADVGEGWVIQDTAYRNGDCWVLSADGRWWWRGGLQPSRSLGGEPRAIVYSADEYGSGTGPWRDLKDLGPDHDALLSRIVQQAILTMRDLVSNWTARDRFGLIRSPHHLWIKEREPDAI